MTAERTYTDYLVDILDAIAKTEQFIQGMTFDRFVFSGIYTFAEIDCRSGAGDHHAILMSHGNPDNLFIAALGVLSVRARSDNRNNLRQNPPS